MWRLRNGWEPGFENSAQTPWEASTEPNTCSCKAGARERGEKHANERTNRGNQQATAIAKLEEQLKAAKSENKRLAAKAQQIGNAKHAVAEPEDVCDEEEAIKEELQTLVDLSTKHFPNSAHTATLRAKLDAERKKKQDAKPVQALCRDRLEKKRKAKAAVDLKVNDLRKQLEDEEAGAAVLAVDIVELEKGQQELQRRAMLTGAATTACARTCLSPHARIAPEAGGGQA